MYSYIQPITSTSIIWTDRQSGLDDSALVANPNSVIVTDATGSIDHLPINAASGIPKLDIAGKILVSQLPTGVTEWKGMYNIVTNTPDITASPNTGDTYEASVAGSRNLGIYGNITVEAGDWIIFASSNLWQVSTKSVYSKSEADARFLNLAGGTLTGGLSATTGTFSGNVTGANATLTGTLSAPFVSTGNVASSGGMTCYGDIVTNNGNCDLGGGTLTCNTMNASWNITVGNGITCWGIQCVGGGLNTNGGSIAVGPVTCSIINTANGNIIMGTGDLSCDVITAGAITCTSVNTTNGNITMGTGDLTCDQITTTGNISTGATGTLTTNAVTCKAINTQNNTITAGTGGLSCGAVTCTSINTTNGNITMGTGDLDTNVISCDRIYLRSNNQYMEFGYGVVGKDAQAGKMGYGIFTADTLDIVGGGTTSGSRTVKIWDDLIVSDTTTTGYLDVASSGGTTKFNIRNTSTSLGNRGVMTIGNGPVASFNGSNCGLKIESGSGASNTANTYFNMVRYYSDNEQQFMSVNLATNDLLTTVLRGNVSIAQTIGTPGGLGGNLYLSNLTTAGVLHNAATTGLVTSSLIVNADITDATIAEAKLATAVSTTSTNNSIVKRTGTAGIACSTLTATTAAVTNVSASADVACATLNNVSTTNHFTTRRYITQWTGAGSSSTQMVSAGANYYLLGYFLLEDDVAIALPANNTVNLGPACAVNATSTWVSGRVYKLVMTACYSPIAI